MCLVSGVLLGSLARLTKRYQTRFPLRFLNECEVFNIFHNALLRAANIARLLKTNSTLFQGFANVADAGALLLCTRSRPALPWPFFSLSFSTNAAFGGKFSYM